jgi:hypothetical protein
VVAERWSNFSTCQGRGLGRPGTGSDAVPHLAFAAAAYGTLAAMSRRG